MLSHLPSDYLDKSYDAGLAVSACILTLLHNTDCDRDLIAKELNKPLFLTLHWHESLHRANYKIHCKLLV